MFSNSQRRRNFASQILGVSALIAASLVAGCAGGSGYGGGGGGAPSLAAAVASQGNFTSGEQGATYTIIVTNSGTAATTGTVTVSDPPTGFAVTSMSGTNWTCTLATTTCTYSVSVNPGQRFPTITVTGNVTSPSGTLVTIPLVLSGGGAPTVNVAPTPSIAVPTAALSITKSHTGNFTQGQVGATYQVMVSNNALAGPTDGSTVVVTDTPQAGLAVTAMAGTGWTRLGGAMPNTVVRSDVLQPGSSYPPITVTVNVSPVSASPQINSVTVTGGGSARGAATDSAIINAAAPTCPLPASGNESLLTGTYIAILSGWKDGAGPAEAVAAFAADGTGVVTSGEMDSGTVVVHGAAQSPPVLTTMSSGCYQVGPDDRGLMIWNFAGGGSVTFAISVSPNNQAGQSDFLIEFDDANPGTSPGTRLAGRFYYQTPGQFTVASFSGPFAFYTTGYFPNSGNTDYLRSGTAGRLDYSGTGAVTNGALNVGFTSAPGIQTNLDNQSFTGTFGPPDSLGRGILTLNFTSFGGQGAITFKFAYYISDANDLYFQSVDTPDSSGHPLQNGDMVTQMLNSYTAAALNGNAILFMVGADISQLHSYTVAVAGLVSGDGLGGSSAMLDQVSNGSALCAGNTSIPDGSFTVLPNGMGVLTIGPGACAKSFSIAMFDQNSGFMLEGTAASPGKNVLTGSLRQQTAPAGGFVDGALSGAYVLGIHNQASTNSIFEVGSVMTPTPQTNPASFSGITDGIGGSGCISDCLSADQAVSTTYSVDANGRITITNPGLTGGESVGWLLNMGRRFIAISDASNANVTILNANH
jgi:uncharacterized repeat protein (TIGR01451 family)